MSGGNSREKKSRRRVLDGRTTKIVKAFLLERDGALCSTCERPSNDAQGLLQVNHKDGNPSNNDPKNLDLKHPACNRQHFLSRLAIREKEKMLEDRNPQNASWEARRKLELEDTLAPLLNRMLLEGAVTVKDAEDRLRFKTGADQQTIRRWIDSQSHPDEPEAPYQISERLVKDRRKMKTLQFIGFRPLALGKEAVLSPETLLEESG